MKTFKELKPGDIIYGFIKDKIFKYTVIDNPKVKEVRFGYFNDNDIRRAFDINTDRGNICFYHYDEERSINFANYYDDTFGFRLSILATSIEEIGTALKERHERALKEKEDAIKSADECIKIAAEQLKTFEMLKENE